MTGATGFVGGRVARRLAVLGVPQRLVVRDPARAPELPGAEVRRASSYGAGEEMRAALAGAATLFLVPAHESADRVAQHRAAVDAAVAAGVRRIVYLSFLGAAPDSTFTLARDHWATEQHIRAAGVPFAFPRMSLYMDFVPLMVGGDGVIRGPADEGRAGVVSRADVADVAVAVLTGEGHDGRSYNVTGPEALTLGEMAATMRELSGKPIAFQDETLAEARASRGAHGAPEWQVDAWISNYTAIAAGELAPVTDTVARLGVTRRSRWPTTCTRTRTAWITSALEPDRALHDPAVAGRVGRGDLDAQLDRLARPPQVAAAGLERGAARAGLERGRGLARPARGR